MMKKKILFVVSLLFGLMFINAGLNKFFQYMPVPDDLPEKLQRMFGAFIEIGWLLPLIALIEIIGGILVIIPKTRALGAAMILPVMVGILFTHIYQAPSGLMLAVLLFVVLLWILFENRRKYLPMIEE